MTLGGRSSRGTALPAAVTLGANLCCWKARSRCCWQIDPWVAPRYRRYNVLGAMAELLAADEYSNLANRMELIDLKHALSAGDFYLLDPHLRPRGYEKMAAELERMLAAAGLLGPDPQCPAGKFSEP